MEHSPLKTDSDSGDPEISCLLENPQFPQNYVVMYLKPL